MFESKNQEFTINPKVLERTITFQELDYCLDHIIDTKNEEDIEQSSLETCYHYILQLFYRSGNTTTTTEKVHNKLNLLIGDRVVTLMKDMGLVEEYYSDEHKDFVYELSEKGRDIVEGEESE